MRDLAKKHNIRGAITNGVGPEKIRLYNDDTCYNNISEFGSAVTQLFDNRVSVNRTVNDTFLMVLLKSKKLFTKEKVRHFKITGTGI